jgi:hypothetical protein
MKSKLWTAALFMYASLAANAGLTINADAIKKTVVFIYPANSQGFADETNPLGTGFLVFVPFKETPGGYLLLVTARHVLDPTWAGCPNSKPLSRIYLRLNLTQFDPTGSAKGVDFVRVDLVGSGPQKNESEPPDPQFDAAVVVLNANDFPMGKYVFGAINISDFAIKSETDLLGTGDSVISAGLLPGAQGERRNYPVFKFGAISNLMDEPFNTACNGGPQVPEKVWLLSVNLYPGASGSAVFYAPSGSGAILISPTVKRASLIGVQSSSILGADISAMTPIEPVFETIEGLQLPNADLFRGAKPVPAPAAAPPATLPTAPAH